MNRTCIILFLNLSFLSYSLPGYAAELDSGSYDVALLEILDLSLEELLNIKLTVASKSETSLALAPGIVSVITRSDIQLSGAKTLSDILNLVPGFTVGVALQGQLHPTLYVRGAFSLFSKDVLMLKDGRRINDAISGGGWTFTTDYPVGNIKQVEVIRGPGSALYGANAFAGVVNIITDRPADTQRVTFRAGDFNAQIADIYASHSFNDDNDLNFFASFINNEFEEIPNGQIVVWPTDIPLGFPTNLDHGTRQTNDDTQLKTIEAVWRYKDFEFSYEFDESLNTNAWGAGVPVDPIMDPVLGLVDLNDPVYRNRGDSESTRLTVKHTLAFDENKQITTIAGSNRGKAELFYSDIVFPNALPSLGYVGDALKSGHLFPEKTETQYIDTTLQWDRKKGHQVVVGFNYQKDTMQPLDILFNNIPAGAPGEGVAQYLGTFEIPGGRMLRDQRSIKALYGQYTWTAENGTAITAGGRYDDYSDFGATFNPGCPWFIQSISVSQSRLSTVRHLGHLIF